ncbi:hypothetical protein CRYUN_Cryun21dG0061500 [Craigia yunnanensis]
MMGLSNFPSAAEGVLPVLVMNTVLSVASLKNMVRSLLQVVGAASSNLDIEDSDGYPEEIMNTRERRISITQFKSLCHDRYSSSSSCEGSAAAGISYCCSSSRSGSSNRSGWANTVECCVCLCGFEADEEVIVDRPVLLQREPPFNVHVFEEIQVSLKKRDTKRKKEKKRDTKRKKKTGMLISAILLLSTLDFGNALEYPGEVWESCLKIRPGDLKKDPQQGTDVRSKVISLLLTELGILFVN